MLLNSTYKCHFNKPYYHSKLYANRGSGNTPLKVKLNAHFTSLVVNTVLVIAYIQIYVVCMYLCHMIQNMYMSKH